MCSGEGSNIIIPIALAAPHILTMTMSFTLWTLKEVGSLVQQQQIISCVLKLESLGSFLMFAALISQSERLLGWESF